MPHADNWQIRIQHLLKPDPNILLIWATFFAFYSSIAQDEIIQWSNPIEIPKSEEIIHYTLVEDSIPAIVTKYGESIIMRSFTNTNQDFPLFIRTDQDPHLVSYNLMGNKLFTLVSQGSDDQINYSLIAFELSSTRAEKIMELPIGNSINNNRELFFSASKNGDYLLLCQQTAFEKQSKTSFSVFTAHDGMADQVSLPSEFEGDDVTLLGATIDDAGIVYFATETGIKLNSPFRKKYLVYSYHPASKTLTEFDLTSSEFFILDLVVTTTEDGAAITCLFSTDPLIEDKSTGYTFVKLNEDGLDIDTRLAGNFDQKMIALLGEDEGGSRSIKDLFLSKPLEAGGETWIAMEKRYKSRICTADPHTGIMTCSDQYHFNAVAFENVFNPSQSAIVNKRQIDYDTPGIFTKQAIIAHNNAIYMFYNDHFKNIGSGHEYVMSNTNRSVIRFAKISGASGLDNGVLSSERQTNFVFVPAFGIAQHQNYSFLLAADGKFFRVGKLDLIRLHGAE